jgi:DNA polymerase-3 subunit epsilon
MMGFVAIDVETANPDMASICQIGLARYEGALLTEEWKSYIDPEDYFDDINISIHGIDESAVRGAPVLAQVSQHLHRFLDNRVAVCHTHFDRVAIQQAFEKYRIRHPICDWLDSARVARRVWEEFAWAGYGLYNVCAALGYEFKHHDALEDAKAAGHILLVAIARSGLDIEGWIKRVGQPIDLDKTSSGAAIRRDGNPEGPLFGEVVVFTGVLEIPRREAADMAARLGCQVGSGVTKETTLLIVGDQDIKRLAGHEKSSKHRKAEKLIAEGHSIRILRESDFKELAALSE